MVCHGTVVVRLNDRLVLAQHQPADSKATAGAWSDAVSKCGGLATKSIDRVSYTMREEDLSVYVLARKSDGLGVATIMDSSVGTRIGYLSCEKTLDLFSRMFPERVATLTAAGCSKAFADPLKDLVEQFADPSIVDDRVAKVKKAVDNVKEIAMENVEKVIDRGEKIESMVEATEQLQENAQGFHSQSTALRRQLWWQNVKARALAVGIVVAFLLVIYLVFCGGFSCKSGDKQ